MEQTPLTNTNLIHVKKVRERIARIRSLGMEISPAMETIILKETEIAFNEGKRTSLDEYKASLLSQIEETSGWSTINGERYIKLEDIKKKII